MSLFLSLIPPKIEAATFTYTLTYDGANRVTSVDASTNNTATYSYRVNGQITQITLLGSGTLDSDNDGMPDDFENLHGLDPNDPNDADEDPDGDELTNLEEFQADTDPNDADTDNDDMPDGFEVAHNFDPLDPSDAGMDADNDGFTNLEEFIQGSDPLDGSSIPAHFVIPMLDLILSDTPVTPPEVLFSDGFESGDTSGWSNTVGN